MAQYVFSHWEDGSTTPVRTLTVTANINIASYYTIVVPTRIISYTSSPISVPCTVNGQTMNPGESIQMPDGTQVTISVPAEVNV